MQSSFERVVTVQIYVQGDGRSSNSHIFCQWYAIAA